MCGNVGMAGDIDKDDRNMFRQMLIVDAIRGHHSTGVASATPKKGELLVFKKALNPVDFMQLRGFDQVVDWSSQVLMGHNRYATVGKINNSTAHPFEHNGVIGTHNGTLEQWYNLPQSKDFDVDSECLIWNIANHGFKETMKRVHGAYALTVYDDNNHELHLLRNKERPLYFGYKEDRSVLYWASEAWMIRNMAARCGIKLAKNIQQPKEHSLLTWKMPPTKNGRMPDPIFTKMEAPQQKKHYPQQGNYQRPYVAPHQAAKGTSGRAGASNYSGSPQEQYRPPIIKGISVGDRVAFCPISLVTSATTNAKYLEGILTEDPWSEVRVYSNQLAPLLDMIDEELVCTAEVATISRTGGPKDDPFIIMNTATVKQLDSPAVVTGDELDPNDVEIIYYAGPGGKMIDATRWNDLTKHGCGYCSTAISDEDDINWVGDSPLCTECSATSTPTQH